MRPIDADKLKEEINKSMNLCAMMGGSVAPLAMCIDYINAAPTVEAAPVADIGDCETCRQKNTCLAYIPTIRRTNCPLWRGKV